jgi:mono/diheme cytochrome c family protein
MVANRTWASRRLENREDLKIMKLDLNVPALLPAALAAALTFAVPAVAQQPAPAAPDNAPFDVEALFASTCGWCHSDGGRAAGKGPQLMNSTHDDDYMKNRIKMGKEGAMPAFGAAFSDAQIDEIAKYIRTLKPR